MFDKITRNYGPSKIDVHEHRAPTDKSVELLKGMEAAAREKVIMSYTTSANNTVQGSAIVMRCHDRAETEVVVQFKLNGHDYRRTHTVDEARGFALDPPDLFRMLCEDIGNAIVQEMLVKGLPAAGFR